jgi:hypothetical protein
MALTTGGTTYVTSTDLVANYPTASLALANRVDVVASGGPGLVKTAGYTITVADILGGNKFLYNSASPGTFTLPTSSLVDGMVVNVAQIGAGALTVSGGTIVGTTVTTAQYQGLSFVYVASGTTWYSIAPNATAPGLAIVSPTSIANSGGSASASGGQVTISGVTSISLNGVFSSTYENYLIQTFFTNTTNDALFMRMRASGTDNSSANYTSQNFEAVSTSLTGTRLSGQTAWRPTNGKTDAQGGNSQLTLFRPFVAASTNFFVNNYDPTSGAALTIWNGTHAVSTSYDGFTIYPNSGALTGTIRVYGFKNS